MAESTHTVRVHQPFLVPKQWAAGPVDSISFTDDPLKAGRYTLAECVVIHDLIHESLPSAVVTTDGT